MRLPPNLQGKWDDVIDTPWNGDYHMNINIQMNHLPMEPGNLTDLIEPLTKCVEDIVESGRETAQNFYGTSEWTCHVLANVWHFISPSEDPSWGNIHRQSIDCSSIMGTLFIYKR